MYLHMNWVPTSTLLGTETIPLGETDRISAQMEPILWQWKVYSDIKGEFFYALSYCLLFIVSFKKVTFIYTKVREDTGVETNKK